MKMLKFILFSCLVGALLAGVFFWSIQEKAEAKNVSVLYAFQVGVFRSEENAKQIAGNYSYAKIVQDQDMYRVFIGVTATNKELFQTLFASYTYYLKEIQVSEDIYEAIQKYDALFLQTSQENQSNLIYSMLGLLPNEL